MSNINELVRPEILQKKPYASFRIEHHEENIWLNANENPWSPDPNIPINRYPEFQPHRLIEKLSNIYEVKPEQILVSRGSDESIDVLIRTACQPNKDKMLICPPTFAMFEITGAIHNVEPVKVPLIKEDNYKLDVTKILNTWNEDIKLVFLVSPNNPTGTLLSVDDMRNVCEGLQNKAIVVVDEAYIEFTNSKSMTNYLNEFENLVILRTLSKAHGLAGARCGCAIAHPDLISVMQRVITPFPIPIPVEQAVLKYLDVDRMKEQVNILLEQRDIMMDCFKSLACIKKVWPSEANFILVEVNNADEIIEHCRQYGLELRNRSHVFGCDHCIRISIGAPEENEKLIEVLKNVTA